MGIITYTLMCYGLTAVISLLVIAIILGINSIMSKTDSQNGGN
jgi:hypothetical protein